MESWEKNLRIGFASNVDLVAVHTEGVNEISPESHKLGGKLFFAGDGDRASREACADRLLDIYDIRQGVPAPGVLDWLQGTSLPREGAVFMEESLE